MKIAELYFFFFELSPFLELYPFEKFIMKSWSRYDISKSISNKGNY